MDFDLTIPPSLTGDTLRLTRRLVLTRQPRSPKSPLSAHIVGSILWSDEFVLRLAGAGPAFPVEIVDFSKISKLAKLVGASWYLDLPASVDTPVLGGLLLLINKADTALVDAVTMQRKTEREQTLLQAIEESVIEQLIRWALSRWEDLHDPAIASVGSAARALTRRVLVEPETWLAADIDAMDLQAAIVHGAREAGLGRLMQ
ncbi:hypothetical protein [Mycobacteroides salmoniphilum]|uniref:hypothetical protein n=1 Tax=Mycobacteroides salmoniphilum TaxID=404941 RepID=UPI0012FF9A9F|nr:hypothetical protein [Mycobacteroides salmoniphilum]